MSDNATRAAGSSAPACSALVERDAARNVLRDVMQQLEHASMGAVGEGGPTLDELDAHVAEHHRPFEDNADYDTMQRAWRIAQRGCKAAVKAGE